MNEKWLEYVDKIFHANLKRIWALIRLERWNERQDITQYWIIYNGCAAVGKLMIITLKLKYIGYWAIQRCRCHCHATCDLYLGHDKTCLTISYNVIRKLLFPFIYSFYFVLYAYWVMDIRKINIFLFELYGCDCNFVIGHTWICILYW